MDEFEFVIPVNREDLRKGSSIRQYVVSEILSPRETEVKIKELYGRKRHMGHESILECFDVFYSIAVHFASMQKCTVRHAWEIALTCTSKIESELTAKLANSDNLLDAIWKKQCLNGLRMSCYSLCQLTECIETEYKKACRDEAALRGKGRKKGTTKSDTFDDWKSEKLKCIQCLQHICDLPLARLWESKVVEQEFVNLVTNCCFSLTEDPDIVKSTQIKEAIFAILGANINKNSYGIACGLKMTQLLQHHEHMAMLFAEAVQVLVEKYECRYLLGDIVREVCHVDCLESAPDSAAVRNTSLFVAELSNRIPHLLLSYVSLLVGLLDMTAYAMRNGVLTAFGKIVQVVLSSEDTDAKLKELRDNLLNRLESHILDEHAFVRSKVLQIWQQLCIEQLIPLGQMRSLLGLVVERLLDKSSIVRKNALLFIGAFLESNPFSARLSLEELQKNLRGEQEKLKDMKPECKQEHGVPTISYEAQIAWETMLPEVEKACDEYQESQEESDDGFSEKEEKELLTYICDLLNDGCYALAIAVMRYFRKEFPESDIFTSLSSHTSQCDAPIENGNEVALDSRTTDDKGQIITLLKKVYLVMSSAHGKDGQDPASGPGGMVTELSKQQILVQYLEDCVAFAEKIQEAIPVICTFLTSCTQSDVQEAVKFFVAAHRFGLKQALVGMRHMLPLIWSTDAALRDAVVDSYRTVYLTPQDTSSKKTSVAVADRLSSLVDVATSDELLSIERLVAELTASGDISQKVIQVLWDRFTAKSSETTAGQSLSAIRLLSMIASPENGMAKANLDKLVSCGLNERAKLDLDFCKYTCCALEKVSDVARLGDSMLRNRMLESHELFTRLKEVLLDTFMDLKTTKWIPAMEKAFSVIFGLCKNPLQLSNAILQELAAQQCSSEVGQMSESSEQESQTENGTKSCYVITLSRLLACAGYVAFRVLVYLDVDVFTDMKRRRLAKEAKVKEEELGKNARRSFSAIAHGTPKRKANASNNEEGEEYTGNAADDADAEFIIHLLDHEVLQENSTLGELASLIVTVTSKPSVFENVQLRTNASLALARLMLVSSIFCEEHLSLFFTILEKSPEPAIRANLVIAVGDLVLRFPNILEPWTGKIYAKLGDPCIEVRKNVLSVLGFLILNDMIKVKGQISELAICITDKNEDIAGMTKDFFTELGKKGNALYNALPDIISHLSDPEHGTDEESFRTILKFLFSNVDKDRQLESFVEKLCFRFRTSETERQWRDLAFCMSLIPFTEKGLRKLHENLTCFGDKLHVDEVYAGFVAMLSNAKKSANLKPEVKTLLEELENVIEELRTKGCTEEELEKRAQEIIEQNIEERLKSCKTPIAARKGQTARKPTRKKITLKDLNSSSTSSEEHSESDETPLPVQVSIVRSKRIAARTAAVQESTNENDEDVASPEASPKLRRPRRKRR